MFELFIILSVVIILVSYRCLRSRYDSAVPVFVNSFIASAVLTTIASVIVFFTVKDSITYDNSTKKRMITYNTKREKFEDDVRYYPIDEMSDDNVHVFQTNNDSVSYVVVDSYEHWNELVSRDITVTDSTIYNFYLNKKDYEVYKSHKNNVK